jgi:hypothetical protein
MTNGIKRAADLGCRFALLLGIPALALPPLWAAGQAIAVWVARLAT